MRVDNSRFAEKNNSPYKEPRYVIELSFDNENTDLFYFTSHENTPLPNGALSLQGALSALSGTSQSVTPEKANATIGAISFKTLDFFGLVTSTVYGKLATGNGLREKRVRVHIGYEGLAWEEYTLIQTQLIESVDFYTNEYLFKCADIQRSIKKDIFNLASTKITASIGVDDEVIHVQRTNGFEPVAHSGSFSDGPNGSYYYFKIDKEIIRASDKTDSSFIGCVRGRLNTKPEEHLIDPDKNAARQTDVKEYVYLEMAAPKLAYALLTGELIGQDSRLPDSWHLGIAPQYVRQSDFLTIGNDLFDLENDDEGFVLRFEGLKKQEAKLFIEKQLHVLMGTFPPIYADGAIGIKRMSGVLSTAGYVAELNEDNVVSHSALTHDMKSVHNSIEIKWNWLDSQDRYLRTNVFFDADSDVIHNPSKPVKFSFRGLNGSRHTTEILGSRFDSFRDRYAGPPLRLSVTCLPSMNKLEVGDNVRVKLKTLKDYNSNDFLDRTFEIQNISTDWLTGKVSFRLFASSQPSTPINYSLAAGYVVPDEYYISEGVNLATHVSADYDFNLNYENIGGVGHIKGISKLTGGENLKNATTSIYYHDGDLSVDASAFISITHNIQLRVKGHLTINCDIDGIGAGLLGAPHHPEDTKEVFQDGVWNYRQVRNLEYPGLQGYLGSTKSMGSFYSPNGSGIFDSSEGVTVEGHNTIAPRLSFHFSNGKMNNIPADIRGSSGSCGRGHDSNHAGGQIRSRAGGAGGNGGAGLFVICRGASFGSSGKVNVSGGDGEVGDGGTSGGSVNPVYYAGSGAGGAPGAVYFAIDGFETNIPLLNKIVACNGVTPIEGIPLTKPSVNFQNEAVPNPVCSYYTGYGCPDVDLSGYNGAAQTTVITGAEIAEQDQEALVITPPTLLQASSGTNELVLNNDGSILTRVKLTWTIATDTRVTGYEVQYNSSDKWFNSAPSIGDSGEAYLNNVKDGEHYSFRIRSLDRVGNSSNWLTLDNYLVLGKTEPPNDVAGLTSTFNNGFYTLAWNANSELDIGGYQLSRNGVVFTTSKTTSVVLGNIEVGTNSYSVVAIDTSGNISATAASHEIIVFVDGVKTPAIESGTTHLIVNKDGSINSRVLITWDAVSDIIGYEVRYKRVTDSAYMYIKTSALKLYVNNLLDGDAYNIDVRTVGKVFNTYSSWVESTYSVIGKTQPPDDIAGFAVFQNGSALVMKWNANTDLDLSGYEIRYLDANGSGLWDDGIVLNEITKGTNITTVDVRDGTWLFMIKAVDTTRNYSANVDSVTVTFASDFDIIDYSSFSPFSSGTLTGLVMHYTGKLVPDSQDLASVGGWDTFDITVQNPVNNCYYEAPEYDNGFNAAIRVSSLINFSSTPIASTGSPNPVFQVDYKTASGNYVGFNDWVAATVEFRHVKARLYIDTSIGVPIVSDFTRVLDSIERTEKAESVPVNLSGTTINFNEQFSLPPFIAILPISTSAVLYSVSARTTTQFTIKLFNATGVPIAGTVDWSAVGV